MSSPYEAQAEFVARMRELGATRVHVDGVFVEFEGATIEAEQPEVMESPTPEDLKRESEKLLYSSSD